MTKRIVSLALAGLLTSTAVGTAGCYGSFAVTKKLYDWNGGLGNKFVKTLVFWGLIIIPAYELVTFGDFIIFNLIEFWTGSNPIGGGKAAAPATRGFADGSLQLQHGTSAYTLVPASADRFYLVVNGATVGSARVTPDGDLVLSVAGRPDLRLGRDQVERMHDRLAQAGLVRAD
jgi:hypothetical protein